MKSNNKISVIIAGAGSASRFGEYSVKSKQFLLLKNKPILLYSIEKFLSLKNLAEIIIVTNDISATQSAIGSKYENIKIVLGGKLRQDSVYNGFANVSELSDLVLIHDVARPLFDLKDVEKCIESAKLSGAAILASSNVDTLKRARLDNDELIVESTVNREGLYLIQTPQVFSKSLLSSAYEVYRRNNNFTFTDEAALVEQLGKPVNLVIGSRNNIKITYPEDLDMANAILNNEPFKVSV